MPALRTLTDWLEVWCKWMPITGISWCVSLVIGSVVVQVVGLALPGAASLARGGLVAGALMGLTQWAMISPQVKEVGWWSLATAIGWISGLAITTLVAGVAYPGLGRVAGLALGGLVLGLVQCSTLAPKLEGRGAWLSMTAVGWTSAMALGMSLPGVTDTGPIAGRMVQTATAGAVGWVLIGLVSTIALICFFHVSHKEIHDGYVRWWP